MESKSLSYTVLIEQDEDGMYIAKVPDIQGCYTQGKTVEQVMERIREAIQVCLEADDPDSVRQFQINKIRDKCEIFI
jgi:predicted RNase H-like HicB family nuclease